MKTLAKKQKISEKVQKPAKISTTVRFDAVLKRKAEAYARAHHMDFTTFLQFSVQSTMKNWAKVEPYYEVSGEYGKELDEMVAQYKRWELEVSGPFNTKEETRAFLNSIT